MENFNAAIEKRRIDGIIKLTPTQKAIHDLRAEFNKTDIQKIFEYIQKLEVELADLKLRFELLQNQVNANEKDMIRHHWENVTGVTWGDLK